MDERINSTESRHYVSTHQVDKKLLVKLKYPTNLSNGLFALFHDSTNLHILKVSVLSMAEIWLCLIDQTA